MKAETQIQSFILNNLSKHQRDIIKAAIGKFGVSRQAVLKHMNTLIREKKVVAYGKTKDRYYELEPILNYSRLFELAKDTKVDHFLQNEIIPNLKKLPKNIFELCEFALNALLTNVYDHSGATHFSVKIFSTQKETHVVVMDNGSGIFQHIRDGLGLEGKTISAIELAKGSSLGIQTDNHAGDDLHAVIMLFDIITIDSSEISLCYEKKLDCWSLEDSKQAKGTKIHLRVSTKSNVTCDDTFAKIFGKESTNLRIPVNLARTNGELLASRYQAQKLMYNIELSKGITFDFKGIKMIGPAFAHELVWIIRKKNLSLDIDWINAEKTVDLLMSRAKKRLINN